MNEYKGTAIVLAILAVGLFVLAFLDRMPILIPVALSYLFAVRNPWKNRIVVNTGFVVHICLIITEMAVRAGTYVIIFNTISLLLLLVFYPSPYPVWMNVTAFLFSPESNVNWIERHPELFRWLSKGSIIGSILGLYYNSRSFSIIQEEGFLGFSPVKDILELASSAGVRDGATVLDTGSGLGGPLCAIAGEYRVRATGIDLLLHNAINASELARRRNLSHRVNFVQGNGMALPFRDSCFDFVFGSDAWVHVPDRDKLLMEAYRVLKPGGVIFFYDWLDTGGVTEGFRFIYAFPEIETMEGYKDKLKKNRFEILKAEFDTPHYVELVENVKKSVLKNKRKITDECGRELYDNWLIVVEYTLKMLYEKKLGHGFFIARKIVK